MKTKVCSNCKKRKKLTPKNFYHRGDGYRHLWQSQCKICLMEQHRKYIKRIRNTSDYKKKTLARATAYRLKKVYGVTQEFVILALKKQKNRCRICLRLFRKSQFRHIDHDHKTGQFRGLLCSNCNHGRGFFKIKLTY